MLVIQPFNTNENKGVPPMSEQHRPDPALPQNPQPGGQGYPQPAPAGQPCMGTLPRPAAELPEKPTYRGTVVAVLIVGIIAALCGLSILLWGFTYIRRQKFRPRI